MKSQLLAGIILSAALHAGAGVLIGEWLSRQFAGLPTETLGVAEVMVAIEAGADSGTEDTSPPVEHAPDPEPKEFELPAQPPVMAEEAPPAPVIEEAPLLVGPVHEASLPNKIAEPSRASDIPKKAAGIPTAMPRGGASRGLLRGTTPANYRSRASLSYPSSALRERAGGRVILWVDVDENGRAEHVFVKQSSGRPDLDAAAIACARQSSYEPHRVEGVAKPCRMEAPFEFKISAADRRYR